MSEVIFSGYLAAPSRAGPPGTVRRGRHGPAQSDRRPVHRCGGQGQEHVDGDRVHRGVRGSAAVLSRVRRRDCPAAAAGAALPQEAPDGSAVSRTAVDDPRYHVRQTALPAPGGDEQLRKLMARVMAQRLDRDYPLWEYWLVEGLADGRWALISKVHHCMVDGISGTDLYRIIFDTSPVPEPLPDGLAAAADSSPVSPEPSALRLAARSALDAAMLPVREASVLSGALANPGDALRQAAGTVMGLAKIAGALRPATGSSLSGPIGAQRRYACARASLDDFKTIKRELGGTVNDIVLAAISSGFRSLLLARGEQPQRHMVPSLVPVSVRAPGEENIYENRLTVILANLPVDIADPADRLAAVRAELATLKASKEAMVGEAMVSLGRYTPFPVASRGARLAYGLPQPEIVTVTTNVPGPRQQLYALGRRLVEIIPYVPIATTLRTGIAIFSYCGSLTFGI